MGFRVPNWGGNTVCQNPAYNIMFCQNIIGRQMKRRKEA